MKGPPALASLLSLLFAAALVWPNDGQSDEVAFVQHSVTSGLKVREEVRASEEDEQETDSDSVFYLHFRLAEDLFTNSSFEVGERAQINVARCLAGGAWVGCEVTGRGATPGTFNIFIPANPVGRQDMRNIPRRGLRTPFKAPFQGGPGDAAEVNVAKCLEDSYWSDCTISGQGSRPGLYNVEVARQGDSQDIPDVPVQALRKKE